jgi:hypothetical protein
MRRLSKRVSKSSRGAWSGYSNSELGDDFRPGSRRTKVLSVNIRHSSGMPALRRPA